MLEKAKKKAKEAQSGGMSGILRWIVIGLIVVFAIWLLMTLLGGKKSGGNGKSSYGTKTGGSYYSPTSAAKSCSGNSCVLTQQSNVAANANTYAPAPAPAPGSVSVTTTTATPRYPINRGAIYKAAAAAPQREGINAMSNTFFGTGGAVRSRQAGTVAAPQEAGVFDSGLRARPQPQFYQ